jgi:hypothetical protein
LLVQRYNMFLCQTEKVWEPTSRKSWAFSDILYIYPLGLYLFFLANQVYHWIVSWIPNAKRNFASIYQNSGIAKFNIHLAGFTVYIQCIPFQNLKYRIAGMQRLLWRVVYFTKADRYCIKVLSGSGVIQVLKFFQQENLTNSRCHERLIKLRHNFAEAATS